MSDPNIRYFMLTECPILYKWAEENIPGETLLCNLDDYLNILGKEVGFRHIEGTEVIDDSLRELEQFLRDKEDNAPD